MHSSASSKQQQPWSTTQNEFIRKWHEIDFPIGTLMLLRSILDDRIRPSFWSTYWKSDTSSWCSKSQIFSKCFYRDTFPVGEKTMTHKQNQAIILKVLLRLLWVVSSCDHSISLNELCDDKQTWKTKKKYSNTDGGRGRFYVVHYQNSERIQKHFRISRFCEIFLLLHCTKAPRDRKTILSGWIWQMQKKKSSSSSFFTTLHNNEDYDGLKLRRNRNKIATSALFYGEGGE